jgi:hypothetical protein
MRKRLRRHDLAFIVETLTPGTDEWEEMASRFGSDEAFAESVLADDRLFRRLMTSEETLLQVSPWLLFSVLLRRARRDLQLETFTVERRDRLKVPLFDTDRVIELLEHAPFLCYVADMLASFTRIESVTVPVRVRKGIWRKYRTSDLDVEGLIRYAEGLEETFRFGTYKRIGDVCLFMSGMFPEYIEAQYRYPLSQQIRPRMRGRLLTRLEDYEAHGRAFYRLAAEHEQARMEELQGVLTMLSDNFILAEKPLTFLANRYLGFARHKLFQVN